MHIGNRLIVITVIILIIIIISKIAQQLHYDKEINNLISNIINVKNNENIFHTINDESEISHHVNVLDISGGAFRDIQFIVYLLRVNDYYLDKNIDMLRMFNVFGGISAGSIIAGSFAYRELILKNLLKNNKSEFIQFMKMFEYTDAQIMKCMTYVANESSQLNYGTLILQWLFHSYLLVRNSVLNVSVFKKITTLGGYLHPMCSSKNKHAHLKKYFDFDMKDISNSRTFITCGVIIPDKISASQQTTTKQILFTNSIKPINDPNIIQDKHISNMADIINISTNTIGLFSKNEQYPNMWDSVVYTNNISNIVIMLFTNNHINLNLNYVSLRNVDNLSYEPEEGLWWWIKHIDALIRIQTNHMVQVIESIQKNKSHVEYFKNETTSFELSKHAILADIKSGTTVSTNDLISFIHNEMFDHLSLNS